jgi:SAM-dependent methyltransferase
MKIEDLEVLRCPFCGGRLRHYPPFEISGDELQTGLIGCSCCAYPVLAGIPYLRTGQTARAALRLLDDGQKDEALQLLLGLTGDRMSKFQALCRREQRCSYRTCLEVLSPNPEGIYFLYRFSDPTFLVSDGLLRALGPSQISGLAPMLDLCGGSGHLTRTLCEISQDEAVWLADLEFWKLWLARQFVAPLCKAVCCDASQPLPFARGTFALSLCSDAFSYIWQRRSLAGEMRRLVGNDGVVIATQLHNALCENPSEGNPLDPAGWRALFEEAPARLFKESAILESVLENKAIDLSTETSDMELAAEPALVALSTTREGFFRPYELPELKPVVRLPAINPLYHCEDIGPNKVLTLQLPSAFYEAEFEACRRYLPKQYELPASIFQKLESRALLDCWAELAPKKVLLDLPENYL